VKKSLLGPHTAPYTALARGQLQSGDARSRAASSSATIVVLFFCFLSRPQTETDYATCGRSLAAEEMQPPNLTTCCLHADESSGDTRLRWARDKRLRCRPSHMLRLQQPSLSMILVVYEYNAITRHETPDEFCKEQHFQMIRSLAVRRLSALLKREC